MCSTESGMVTLVKERQCWKARSPINVDESGIATLVNEMQPLKLLS